MQVDFTEYNNVMREHNIMSVLENRSRLTSRSTVLGDSFPSGNAPFERKPKVDVVVSSGKERRDYEKHFHAVDFRSPAISCGREAKWPWCSRRAWTMYWRRTTQASMTRTRLRTGPIALSVHSSTTYVNPSTATPEAAVQTDSVSATQVRQHLNIVGVISGDGGSGPTFWNEGTDGPHFISTLRVWSSHFSDQSYATGQHTATSHPMTFMGPIFQNSITINQSINQSIDY